MIGQIIFAIATAFTFFFAYKQFSAIYRNIKLGKDEKIAGDTGERVKNTLLIAFGQKKMFQRPLAAVLHLFVYVAFLITQVELLEIFIDGIFGTHRFFWYQIPLGGFYTFVISSIEVLSVLALVATFAFLARRNALRLPRFNSPEMQGWPKLDANNILYIEIVLVTCIFMMNAADMARPEVDSKYGFWISGMISPFLEGFSDSTLVVLERIGWWGHIFVVFAFLNYLPHSKHLHIMLAFPNTYFAPLKPKGEMDNVEEIQKEVASMFDPEAAFAEPEGDMDEIPTFGAKDVKDLSWRHILAAYTCTECGRCTSVCPANQTGKLLSPRKIVMDVRDRADEMGKNIAANKTEFISAEQQTETSVLTKGNYDDGKNLFDYITAEELRACTTCTACVDACPILISPMDMILELRRNLILEQSDSPESWNAMFNAVENNAAPWAFSQDDRDKWVFEAMEAENKKGE